MNEPPSGLARRGFLMAIGIHIGIRFGVPIHSGSALDRLSSGSPGLEMLDRLAKRVSGLLEQAIRGWSIQFRMQLAQNANATIAKLLIGRPKIDHPAAPDLADAGEDRGGERIERDLGRGSSRQSSRTGERLRPGLQNHQVLTARWRLPSSATEQGGSSSP